MFRRVVSIFAVAALSMGLVVTGASSASAAPQDEIASLVNAERTKAGLAGLRHDSRLDAIAQEWAATMQSTGRFEHSPGGWRAQRLAQGWTTHGENIAYGYRSAPQVMAGWMGSQGHRENILRSTFTRIGVGYVASGNYWVQIFAGYKEAPPAYGFFDDASANVSATSANITVQGWAVNGKRSTESLDVHIWVTDPTGAAKRYIVTANTSRPDVGRAFQGAGDNHGFSSSIPIGRSGSYSVCPSVISYEGLTPFITALGCKNVIVGPSRPGGSLDEAAIRMDGAPALHVRGWARDSLVPTASTPVHLYVTSPSGRTTSHAVTAGGIRNDVASAFPGSGPYHGFEFGMAISQVGTYKVCAYAIGGSVFVDSHSLLGCRDVRFGPSAPIGAFDTVTYVPLNSAIRATGWSFDNALRPAVTETHLYVTGPDGRTRGYIAVSNGSRPDVGRAYPGAGDAHGYSIDLPASGPGVHTVCTYPISAKQFGEGHSTLPCKQVRVGG